jgi:hypothetical protein
MRGDDALALASARLLTAARPTLESEAHRRGFPRPRSGSATWNEPYQDYLTFLVPLPDLLADQERRALEGVPGGSRAEVSGLTNQPARIAALIGQLDQVAVRQWGQPGGLGPWETDPVVASLLKEGPAAIEPLLACLEGSRASRFTRSVSFWRDFGRDRYLHPVSQPVVDILVKLMDASYATVGIPRGVQTPSNTVLATRLRAYWAEYGKLPPAECWFHKLAEDKAGSAAWTDALGNIVHTADSTEGNTNQARLAGETLRAKTKPSVTDLLVRRAKTLADSAQSYNSFAVGEAVAFPLNAEKWEAPPLLPIAADLQEKVMAGYDGTDNVGSTDPWKAGYIASLALLRARHGDTRGLDALAAWIQQAKPGVLEESALDALEPFWRFPAGQFSLVQPRLAVDRTRLSAPGQAARHSHIAHPGSPRAGVERADQSRRGWRSHKPRRRQPGCQICRWRYRQLRRPQRPGRVGGRRESPLSALRRHCRTTLHHPRFPADESGLVRAETR